MNPNTISPYIRVAMHSYLKAPFFIRERVIFDYELIFIESGYWNFTLEGVSHICKQNDILFIHPGQRHSIESVDGVSVSQPHIHFDMCYDEYSEKVYVSFKNLEEFGEEERRMIRSDIFPPNVLPLKLPVSDLAYFKTVFYEVIDLFTRKPNLYELLYKEKMLALLYYLFTGSMAESNLQPAGQNGREVMVKEYLENNYKNEITLDVLSKQFFIDKFYLEKSFKKKFGASVIQYLGQVRLLHAKEFLLAGHGVGETAERVGFSSIYSFSRFFKKNTGISPNGYSAKVKK